MDTDHGKKEEIREEMESCSIRKRWNSRSPQSAQILAEISGKTSISFKK
jgi:hypothetical protein